MNESESLESGTTSDISKDSLKSSNLSSGETSATISLPIFKYNNTGSTEAMIPSISSSISAIAQQHFDTAAKEKLKRERDIRERVIDIISRCNSVFLILSNRMLSTCILYIFHIFHKLELRD